MTPGHLSGEREWPVAVIARDEDGVLEVAWVPGDDVDVRGKYEQGGFALATYHPESAPNVLSPDEMQLLVTSTVPMSEKELKAWQELRARLSDHLEGQQ